MTLPVYSVHVIIPVRNIETACIRGAGQKFLADISAKGRGGGKTLVRYKNVSFVGKMIRNAWNVLKFKNMQRNFQKFL